MTQELVVGKGDPLGARLQLSKTFAIFKKSLRERDAKIFFFKGRGGLVPLGSLDPGFFGGVCVCVCVCV